MESNFWVPGKYAVKKILVLLIMAVLSLALVAGVYYWRDAARRRRSGPARAVRSVAELQERMDGVAASSAAMTLHTLGEIPHDGATWPITMITCEPDGPARFRVLLTGGVHGNEPAGAEALLQFAEDLAQGSAAYSETAFDIIPVVNPWGWVHRRRRNAEDRDLNRDFASFNAPESRIIKSRFDSSAYNLMVDLHEDSHVSGFYFYRLAHPNDALCQTIIERVRNAGHPIHHGRVSKIFQARDGVISCALWSLRLARAIRQLSLSNYCRLQGRPQSFLFETPSRLPLDARVAMHRIALDALLTQGLDRNEKQ